MTEDSLNDKRSRILLLEKDIKEISEEIKKKKIQAGEKNRQLEILKLKLPLKVRLLLHNIILPLIQNQLYS